MGTYIIIILWSALSLLTMTEYIQYCFELNNVDKLIVSFIFIIGGPFFVINNVLCYLLNYFLPEGWDDDDRH